MLPEFLTRYGTQISFMNTVPQPEPADRADEVVQEIVFRCLEADDAEEELARAGGTHPDLVPRARAMLEILRRQGMLEGGPSTGIPDRVGPYVLGERLGEGGMGVVFAARDTTLDVVVAVKIVRPDMMPFANSWRRFDNEIAALARLHHPGIAQVFSSGEDKDIRYYAMEFVDGESLAQILARVRRGGAGERTGCDLFASPLEPVDAVASERTTLLSASWVEACVRIVRDVATALAHAHDQGILHRDIKPGNIILGGDGRPRLIDFGLARADDAQTMTRSGAVVGSLAYMAPEQVLGKRAEVDVRSDVYALGVVLYELLTLRSPFANPDDPETTRRRILRGRPPRAKKVNPEIGHDLDLVCAKAMARDRELRHQTAGQLAGDLDAVFARGEIHSSARMRRFAQRHPTAIVRAATAALIAVIGLSVWLTRALGERNELAAKSASLATTVANSSAATQAARWLAYRGLLASAEAQIRAADAPRARALLALAPEEHRAWEWRYLTQRAAAPRPRWRLQSNTGGTWYRLHLAAGGENLVLGRGNNDVTVCRRADGDVIRSWHFPGSQRRRTFSADGSVYAWVTREDPSRLHWCDLGAGKRGGIDVGEHIADSWLDDRRSAVVRLESGSVLLVDLSSASVTRRTAGEGRPVRLSRAATPTAVAVTSELEFEVQELRSGKTRWRGSSKIGSTSDMRFYGGGSCMVAISGDRVRVQAWRLRDGQPLAAWHLPEPEMLAVDPDGEHVWTKHDSGSLRCWSVTSGRCLLERLGYPSRTTTIAFDVARGRLLMGEQAGARRFYELDLTARKGRWLEFPKRVVVRDVAVHSDGSLLAYSREHPAILRRAAGPRITLKKLGGLHSAAFLDTDRIAVAPVSSGEVLVYDLAKREITARLRARDTRPRALVLLGDGRLASGSEGRDVLIWNVETRRCELVLHGHEGAVEKLVALPGSRLATAGRDGKVRIWNLEPAKGEAGDAVVVETSTLLMDLHDPVYGLAATADGGRIAAGGRRGEIRVCEVVSGRELARIHGKQVTGLAFSPGGRRLLHADSTTSALRVYDTATWDEVVALRNHDDNLTSVQLAPDGTVVTTDFGGLVKLWRSR